MSVFYTRLFQNRRDFNDKEIPQHVSLHETANHVEDAQQHLQQWDYTTRNEITNYYGSEESLTDTSDISFVFDDLPVDITLPLLYSLLCNQMRETRNLWHQIKFLPEFESHADFLCDENGTRLTISNSNAHWATIMVNIEFIQPLLYYCEYDLLQMDTRFFMFGFISRKKAWDVKRSCIHYPRFYASDVSNYKIVAGVHVSLYSDFRTKGDEKMHLFINDEYVSTQYGIELPVVPVVSIANCKHSVRLNPFTFVAVPFYYHGHVVPNKENVA
jgi:hypothetical protein